MWRLRVGHCLLPSLRQFIQFFSIPCHSFASHTAGFNHFFLFFSLFFQLYQRVVNKQRQRCRIGSIVVFIPSIYEFLVSIWRLLASTGTMPGVKFNRKGPQVEWVTRCVHYLYICPSCLFLVRNLPRQRRLNNEQINWTTKQPQNVHRHNEYY